MKLNIPYLLLGILLLLIGTTIYLIDRPPDQTYFLFSNPFQFNLYDILPPLFGPMSDFLPHFFHVTAFILMTVGILDCGKKGYLPTCLFWVFVNAGFELGQKYSVQAANLVPDWFDGIYLLENTKNYFLYGTYCRLDIAAIIIGSILVYIFLVFNHNEGRHHEPQAIFF